MGSVDCICPSFEGPIFDDDLYAGNLCTYDFAAGDMYTTVAFSLTGGNLFRWYRDRWGGTAAAEARDRGTDPYEALLGEMPATPSPLLVLPHFTPTGTPSFDPDARGAVLGLTLGTTRGEFLRGLLEGVAFEMKLNVSILDGAGLPIDEFLATGGGARSPVLVQLKADVLDRPITTVEVTEAGCMGAGILAEAALSGRPAAEIARERVRPGRVIEPDPGRAAVYGERFEEYRHLHDAVKPFCRRRPAEPAETRADDKG
jgi:xylulokinase